MARAPTTELDSLINQYQHESQRPRADQALFILKKIGSLVKPIMRQRGWKVGVLAEFYPNETNLLGLNVNRGQKINLRLRYPGDVNQFLPLEQVTDTMLHELCHIVIGPHNADFHALWDQLRDEHEALIRKGYTGEGFLGNGQRLGGRRVPMSEARRIARASAERRRNLTAGSGQKLGGSGILRGQDARAIIAAAAERRNRIERGCASGTATGDRVAQDEAIKKEKVTTTQAEREDENEATILQAYIDLIHEDDSSMFRPDYTSSTNPNDSPSGTKRPRPPGADETRAKTLVDQQRQIEQEIERQRSNKSQRPSDLVSPFSSSSIPSEPSHPLNPPIPPSTTSPSVSDMDTWTCEICTLVNPMDYLACAACTIERPAIFSELSTVSPPPPPAVSRLTPRTSNVLKTRSSAHEALSRFEAVRAAKVASAPLGWRCVGCANFMEAEWWTCANCGRMKSSS